MRLPVKLATLAVAALLMITSAGAGEKFRVTGKPEDYKAGDTYRYAVWHDDDGWHMRTTTAKKEHHFKGAITVKGGKIIEVKLVKGDRKDRFVLGPEKHNLIFDFTTDEGEDGLDFRCGKEADSIEWNLEIGGEDKGPVKKQPGRIFIGKKGEHPDEVPFTTTAHPKAK